MGHNLAYLSWVLRTRTARFTYFGSHNKITFQGLHKGAECYKITTNFFVFNDVYERELQESN